MAGATPAVILGGFLGERVAAAGAQLPTQAAWQQEEDFVSEGSMTRAPNAGKIIKKCEKHNFFVS